MTSRMIAIATRSAIEAKALRKRCSLRPSRVALGRPAKRSANASDIKIELRERARSFACAEWKSTASPEGHHSR